MTEALFCCLIGEIDIYYIQTGIRNEPKEGSFPPPSSIICIDREQKYHLGKELTQISFFLSL